MRREVGEELIQKHFGLQDLNTILEDVNDTKSTDKNKDLVSVIKDLKIVNLKNEIKRMSEDEIKTKKNR